jgi:hypothetical protein
MCLFRPCFTAKGLSGCPNHGLNIENHTKIGLPFPVDAMDVLPADPVRSARAALPWFQEITVINTFTSPIPAVAMMEPSAD